MKVILLYLAAFLQCTGTCTAASTTTTSLSTSITRTSTTLSTSWTSTATSSVSTDSGIYSEICPFGYCTLNGGTTGGLGGPVTVVSSLEALIAAVTGDSPKIVVVSGTITGNVAVLIGSNTSIFGRNASLIGVGLRVLDAHNVIIRNMKIGKCLAPIDSIGVQGPTTKNIWIDHCELYADQDHDKDYYDGLLDITHAVDYATVSNIYFHDHFKGSLVGHSDSNCPEDTGHLLVTYAYNYWNTIYSRGPMVRCGQVHVFNSYYYNLGDAIRTRAGAQMLVENCVFELTNDCIITKDGYAVARGNDYGQGTNEAPAGTFTTAPYAYNLMATSVVKSYCQSNAGAILTGI